MTQSEEREQERVPLRVLLISPVPVVDPPSGDVTYTQQLLAAPPPGVTYTTYVDAIAEGTLTELGTRDAMVGGRGRDRVSQAVVAAVRKAEGLLRRSGWAYRERVRVFRVAPDVFDLVHVHVFHHRFVGKHPPVVASAGGPLRWVYADAWGWSRPRLAVAELVDSAVGRLWDATMCGARLGRADLFVGPSDYLRTWLLDRGWPADRVAVQPNYLAHEGTTAAHTRMTPLTLGFVARDFTAKGGAEVLAAFETLRVRHPALRLHVVGSRPRLTARQQQESGVRWEAEVAREELLDRVLPSIDLLVYPSRCDTGVPYSSMEALAQGIPAVVSDYRSLPDLVGHEAGLVCRSGDAGSVADAVEQLLEPGAYAAASAGAARRFTERFSAVSQAPRLRRLYDTTLARSTRP